MKKMKRMITALMMIATITACGGRAEESGLKKINLGKQSSAIALASGNNNDVKLTTGTGNTTTLISFTVNASDSTLTGMDATTVTDGDLFLVRNTSVTGNLIITNLDSNSLAANRFTTAGAVNHIVPPKSGVLVEYDTSIPGWVMPLSVSGAPAFTGKVRMNGPAASIPVLSGCGTSPTISAGSTDSAGKITTGSAATTCTITFGSTFGANAPTCILAPEGNLNYPTYTVSATAITVTVDVASTTYNYVCFQR